MKVQFTTTDECGLWVEGDVAEDLGWETPLEELDPDLVRIRLLKLERTGELLSLTDPFGRGIIRRLTEFFRTRDGGEWTVSLIPEDGYIGDGFVVGPERPVHVRIEGEEIVDHFLAVDDFKRLCKMLLRFDERLS